LILFLSGDTFEEVFKDCLNEFEFEEKAEKIPKFFIGICFGLIFRVIVFVFETFFFYHPYLIY
jgi:hypothetical protein